MWVCVCKMSEPISMCGVANKLPCCNVISLKDLIYSDLSILGCIEKSTHSYYHAQSGKVKIDGELL